jgi:AmmeMemoRadiSam system protein B
MVQTVRKPGVAGKFYPANPMHLKSLHKELITREKEKIRYDLAEKSIIGAILPHAAHFYSGYQTVHFFEILAKSKQLPETFIILHPLHRGTTSDFVCDNSTHWQSPLGLVKVDTDFIRSMNIGCASHELLYEHSAEVFIPFIQQLPGKTPAIVPIGFGNQYPETAEALSQAIITAWKTTGRKISIIASCDFSHFLSPSEGYKKDQFMLDHILSKNIDGVYKAVVQHKITACGYGPVMSLMHCANAIYPSWIAETLARGHSGEVMDSNQVVDYISVLFYF